VVVGGDGGDGGGVRRPNFNKRIGGGGISSCSLQAPYSSHTTASDEYEMCAYNVWRVDDAGGGGGGHCAARETIILFLLINSIRYHSPNIILYNIIIICLLVTSRSRVSHQPNDSKSVDKTLRR